MRDERKLEQIEKVLQARGGVRLSRQFKSNVMTAISKLPAPAFSTRPRGLALAIGALRLLSPGEIVAMLLVVAGLAALMLPGVGTLIDNLQWDLADLHVSLELGSSAVSANVVGLIAVALALAVMAFAGAYVSRNHLIHA